MLRQKKKEEEDKSRNLIAIRKEDTNNIYNII